MGVAVKVWLGTRDCASCYRQRNFLKWVTVLQSGSESAVSNECTPGEFLGWEELVTYGSRGWVL